MQLPQTRRAIEVDIKVKKVFVTLNFSESQVLEALRAVYPNDIPNDAVCVIDGDYNHDGANSSVEIQWYEEPGD